MPTAWNKLQRLRKGLRFRLTLSYLIIFGILLSGIGLVFHLAVSQVIRRHSEQVLEEEWQASLGFLQIRQGKAEWIHPQQDIETAFLMQRLQRIYLVAEANGDLVDASAGYRRFGLETKDRLAELVRADRPRFETKLNQQGEECLLLYRRATLGGRPYLLAHGLLIDENLKIADSLTLNYFEVLPFLLLACGVLGWFFAKPAIEPVNRLAAIAQEISSSNLKMRISSNGSRDEVDLLIVAFNKMLARLEENFEQIRRFSTDVSHELRTPLTTLRGHIEVSLMTAKTKEEFQTAMEGCLGDVDRISNIVRSLLLLAQSETGQVQLQKKPVDLGELVEVAIAEFQIPADAAKVRLASRASSGLLIDGDYVQLERLLFNLISNALKFTPEGGLITITLDRSLVPERPGVILAVADTGKGIAPEDVPYIFDRFYKSASSKNDGLGLGLSFVAWIVKAHDGEISVHSTPGQGSTFTIFFPTLPQAG